MSHLKNLDTGWTPQPKLFPRRNSRKSLLIHANPALQLTSHAEKVSREIIARNPLTDSLRLLAWGHHCLLRSEASLSLTQS